ncbi:RepB family plasmid replication initiator protein [Erwinia sp. JUb26]|uniref:RepB family plasmid replication initiator protein n=1 Tax=Erwinia sp. JUb26 TaxID=2485126 RepID=UPI000F46A46A|nr:RepB family plasmid replication initiator protein [Erwinia sp. JUb26]ROR10063.1 replication initiator protein [Erwinia sp. JUb26]
MPDKDPENKMIADAFSETDKRTGEVINLTPNTNNTVQPVALMRLGLFVPTLKSTARGRKNQMSTMDVTEELKQLSIVKSEGYENIKITGARLDMDNDFKTWVGIIHAFAKYKVLGDSVTLPFIDFAKLCGIPSVRSSARLRSRLDASLTRIATNTIAFSSKEGEYYVTHLVQSAKYSTKNDSVTLQADPKIFELYQFDKKVLLQLRAINELSRKESAQALYTFIESLPPSPAPISMARLRARLNLTSRTITQNATVRKAMEQLKEIGYLDYTEVKRGKVVYFVIHYRRPKLRPADIPLSLPDLGEDEFDDIPDSAEKEGEMVMLSREELELLEKIRKGRKPD